MLPGKKLDVAEILKAVRRRRWLVILPPLVGFFGALLYSSTLPDVYQSDMLIAIDPQRVPDTFVRSTVTLETDRRLDTLTVQVLSRTVLQGLIEEYDLYREERAKLPPEDVIAEMRKNIKVDLEIPRPRWGQQAEPSAFHVRFTHPDPNISARVTQKIGMRFVEQNTRDRSQQAGATNRFLETQLKDARASLESQERKLESFRQQHGKELPTQMTSNMQALNNAQLQAQSLVESIARDRDRKQMLERLYREAAAEPATAAPTTATAAQPAAPGVAGGGTAQQQLATAKATLESLKLRYKPGHPDVVRAERLVAELEPKAEAEEKTAAAAATSGTPATPADPAKRESLRQMRAEIESLDRQIAFKDSEEQRVRSEIGEYQRRIEAVPGLESEWVALTRDYDTQQAAYKDLLTKSAAAQVAANLEQQEIGERFRIVDPAVVPVHPLPAVRIRVNAAGLAIGLLLGVGFALLLEFRDASYRSDQDVLEVLALPVLASIPRIDTEAEKRVRQRQRMMLSAAGITCAVVAGYLTWALKLWNSLI
jgi:polysaccharide chain length determinant protein (PEP-CTERM system associated)